MGDDVESIDDPENKDFMEEASDAWEEHPAEEAFGPEYVAWLNKEMGK